jgi:hypothetical protein
VVDVGVHPGQGELDRHPPGLAPRREERCPRRVGHGCIDRVEVEAGEDEVEARHEGGVGEPAGHQSVTHELGDP